MVNSGKSTHLFFIDETGDHGLRFIDANFPIFLLVGCLFEIAEYEKISKNIHSFKRNFFGSDQVILHSRDIRKCEGVCKILLDIDIRKRFYTELNDIMCKTKFIIVAAAIDKRKYIQKHGNTTDNPYALCLSSVLEHLILIADEDPFVSGISITIEKRGLMEDKQLIRDYNTVMNMGTLDMSGDRFRERISDCSMHAKSENNIGLQIADLCAYPLARHMLRPLETYIPFDIIKNKLFRGGIILFP